MGDLSDLVDTQKTTAQRVTEARILKAKLESCKKESSKRQILEDFVREKIFLGCLQAILDANYKAITRDGVTGSPDVFLIAERYVLGLGFPDGPLDGEYCVANMVRPSFWTAYSGVADWFLIPVTPKTGSLIWVPKEELTEQKSTNF